MISTISTTYILRYTRCIHLIYFNQISYNLLLKSVENKISLVMKIETSEAKDVPPFRITHHIVLCFRGNYSTVTATKRHSTAIPVNIPETIVTLPFSATFRLSTSPLPAISFFPRPLGTKIRGIRGKSPAAQSLPRETRDSQLYYRNKRRDTRAPPWMLTPNENNETNGASRVQRDR